MQKFYTSAHEQQARVDDNETFDLNKYSSFDNQAQCNVTKLKEIKSIVQSEDFGGAKHHLHTRNMSTTCYFTVPFHATRSKRIIQLRDNYIK